MTALYDETKGAIFTSFLWPNALQPLIAEIIKGSSYWYELPLFSLSTFWSSTPHGSETSSHWAYDEWQTTYCELIFEKWTVW
jgi:hypothetical protein